MSNITTLVPPQVQVHPPDACPICGHPSPVTVELRQRHAEDLLARIPEGVEVKLTKCGVTPQSLLTELMPFRLPERHIAVSFVCCLVCAEQFRLDHQLPPEAIAVLYVWAETGWSELIPGKAGTLRDWSEAGSEYAKDLQEQLFECAELTPQALIPR